MPKEYKEKLGAIWEKETKDKKRKYLSIQIKGDHFFGFLNLNPVSERSPQYWLQQFNVDGKTIRCGGAWAGTSLNKKTELLWLQLEDWRYVAMPNPYIGVGNNQPKYLVYLAYSNKNLDKAKKLVPTKKKK